MFGILMSALNQALAFIFRGVVFKFGAFTILLAITTAAISALTTLLPSASSLSVFSQIPSGVWYFSNAFAISQGVTLTVGAYVTRFIIRRLPIIG